MEFGPLPTTEAEGAYLAHAVNLPKGRFKKGRRLSADDLGALEAAGIEEVIAARLEASEVHEDEATAQVAAALAGAGLMTTAAFTGRCNLIVGERGLLNLNRAKIDRLNALDETLTVATLGAFDLVEPRQMAATIKIIPFALSQSVLQKALAIAAEPLLSVAPLRSKRVGLVQTTLPGLKPSILDKTTEVTNRRLAALDCPPVVELRCPHLSAAVSQAIAQLEGCDLVLVSGASAIVDRRDVVPEAIERAGGRVRHFGMPVDPGNLILLAEKEGRPLLGLPGCARSPKLNGFDWVLERLVAEIPVGPGDIQAMGIGGLLKDTAQRPLPRSAAVEPPAGSQRAPRVAALVLAAGQAKRMGRNKLIEPLSGKPLVRHAVEAALASQAEPVILVTGHQREAVEEALDGLDLLSVHNRNFAAGLSTSLKRGLAALPEGIEAAVVLLGDMPRIAPATINRLIASFNPLESRAICLPTFHGKRGNPVLLGRQFFAEAQTTEGDQGARELLREYADLVAEVPFDDSTILLDVDTPSALAAVRADQEPA